MNPYKETIQKAAAILESANEEVKTILLSDPNLYTLAQTTYNQISEIKKRLYGLAGLPASGAVVESTVFAPLTNVMGIQVDQRKPITEDDMKPTLTEKEKLFERIGQFYNQVSTMFTDKVLEIVREPKGEAILRGVAKMAGVENWRDAEIDVLFIEEIKQGITDKREVDDALKTAEGSAFRLDGDDLVERPWEKALPESTTEKPVIPDQVNPDNKEVRPNELKDLVKTPFEESQEKQEKEVDDALKTAGDKEVSEQAQIDDQPNPLIAEAKRLKAEGKTTKEISELLGISTGTVSNYTKAK